MRKLEVLAYTTNVYPLAAAYKIYLLHAERYVESALSVGSALATYSGEAYAVAHQVAGTSRIQCVDSGGYPYRLEYQEIS
jgi:hypothetical protein